MSALAAEPKHIILPGGGLHLVGAPATQRKQRVYRSGGGRAGAKVRRETRALYDRLQLEGLTQGQLAIGGPTITAAATRIEKATSQDLRRLIQPWQARALTYYDMVGEVWFSSQFYSRTLAKVRLFPAVLDDDGNAEESDDPTLQDLWSRVQDPSGSRSELQASYGRLMFLIGEGYLIVSPDDDWGEVWEFLSPDELRVQPGGIMVRYRAPQIGTQEYYTAPEGDFIPLEGIDGRPDTVVPWRLWRKHPRYSWWADSPMHAVLDVLEEIVLLTLAVRSKAKSRAANSGVLLWPDEMSFPQLDASGDEDPLNDPFFEEFAANWMGPLNDPGSASAGVPLFVRMASALIAENTGGPRYMKFDSTDPYAEQGIRNELIRRYAMGVDLPPEQLLGQEDSNHWTAWLVDEQSWKAHLMPVTQNMCNDFGSAYLRPAARDAGVANWEKVVVGYDATEVINHPDKGKDYLDLYNARAIGKSALRSAKGATDDDAMPQDELDEAIGILLRDGSYVKYGYPQIRGQGIEPQPGEIEDAATGNVVTAPGETPPAVEKGPPAMSEPPDEQPITAAASSNERILWAAENAVDRCRELAGSRIVTRVRNQRCEDCLDAIDNVDVTMVASALGEERIGELKLVPLKLVAGGARAFARGAGKFGLVNGYGPELAEVLEQHAAETLFDPDPEGLPEVFHRMLEAVSG